MKLVFKMAGIAAVTELKYVKIYYSEIVFTAAILCTIRTRSLSSKLLLI